MDPHPDDGSSQQSINRLDCPRLALMQIKPSTLDITAHHVDPAIGHVAVAGAKSIECGSRTVAFLILALAGSENFRAGYALEIFDVRFINIDLEQQGSRPAGCFQHHGNPFPLRGPSIKLFRAEDVDALR
jgi:hypothetical protein